MEAAFIGRPWWLRIVFCCLKPRDGCQRGVFFFPLSVLYAPNPAHLKFQKLHGGRTRALPYGTGFLGELLGLRAACGCRAALVPPRRGRLRAQQGWAALGPLPEQLHLSARPLEDRQSGSGPPVPAEANAGG